jgi:hypothetical protein
MIKEIFSSDTKISSLAAFSDLLTLRLLDVSKNEISSLLGLPPLSILDLGEFSPCFNDSESLQILRDMLHQGQLRSFNPPDIRAVSCFQNFGELAFGPNSNEKQSQRNRLTSAKT